MNRNDIEAAVRDTLETVLKTRFAPEAPIERKVAAAWDSLKHVEILFGVEDALGIRFDEEEMAGLDSLDKLVAAAEKHLAA